MTSSRGVPSRSRAEPDETSDERGMQMAGWIDDLAGVLGEEDLSDTEISTLLEIARDVAHRVARKVTPLSTFLLGSAVGRRLAAGSSRDEALAASLDRLRSVLPDARTEG